MHHTLAKNGTTVIIGSTPHQIIDETNSPNGYITTTNWQGRVANYKVTDAKGICTPDMLKAWSNFIQARKQFDATNAGRDLAKLELAREAWLERIAS